MINIKEYLMTKETEERRVYHIVQNGRIDLLRQIFPDAETLVAKTENCREFGYDIMGNLANDGNTDMLKKILSAYFSENTEENNALKRRFLLSHHVKSSPKDYHYFESALSPREKLLAKYELTQDLEERNKIEVLIKGRSNVPDNPRRAEFYYLLRDEYQKSLPLDDPHRAEPGKRLGIAPKGVSATESIMYIGDPEKNALVSRSWQETYPQIRLVKIPENQQPNRPLRCPVEELAAIPYRPGQKDLARQAFNKMHFPDLWFGDNYFRALHCFDAVYDNIRRNDPVFAASFKNFNENGKFISLENRQDRTLQSNAIEGTKYGAYSSGNYICLLSDTLPVYMQSYILHELAHDTDRSNQFCNTDIYGFSVALMTAHPKQSIHRHRAVSDTRSYYPASQFERESLARIAEAGMSASLSEEDKLLSSVYKMFSAYGEAQLNREDAVLNRIKLCARLRLPGRPGYGKFEEAAKARRYMHIVADHHRGIADGIYYDQYSTPPAVSQEELQKAEADFANCCRHLNGGRYMSAGGKDMSYLIAEEEIVKCIEAELRDIEKIRQNPLAAKVVLNLDTVSRDNITDDMPLELLAAEEFSRVQKLGAARVKITPDEKMREELKFHADACRNIMQNLQKDAEEGMPFDRALFRAGIGRSVHALAFAEKTAEHYFPGYRAQPLDINRCLPQTDGTGNSAAGTEKTLENIDNLQGNIELMTTENPDLRLSAEAIGNPYFSVKRIVEYSEQTYKEELRNSANDNLDISRLNRNRDIGKTLKNIEQQNSGKSRGKILSQMRTMQLLYRELHPNASRLPEELQFASLTADSFVSPEKGAPSPAEQTLQKYCRQLSETLAAQNAAVRPAARGYND